MIRNDLPKSLVDNPELGQWIGFEPPGSVRLATGKVELGQGILTALRQIAAEELHVAPERIGVISGETGRTPEEGMTAGSQSVEASGGSIRLVCAEVRQLALQAAAENLDCAPAELTVADGLILRGEAATGLSYWTMPRLDLARRATGTAPLQPSSRLRVIGQSLPRTDLPAKLAGAAFIHDLSPDELLHARVLRRPARQARLETLDEAIVQRLARGPVSIVRRGEFLAVIAEDEAVAERALIGLARTAQWSGVTPKQTRDADPALLRELPSIDRIVTVPGSAPQGAVVREYTATYTRPYLAHASIGPCCALALFDKTSLTVWSHSQGVGPLRNAIARALRLDVAQVQVLHRQAAGCYGHNGADDVALDAAILAMERPGRTVRVQWSRADELSAAPFGAASVVTMRAGLGAGGRPVTWDMEIWSPPHGRRPGADGGINLLAAESLPGAEDATGTDDVPDAAGGGGNRNSVALYDLPEQRILHHLVPHPPLRTSSLRGLGAQANVFAIESFVDELAEAAAQCPVAYRLAMLSDPRARRVIEATRDMSPWMTRNTGGTGRGLGFAFSRYKNRAAYLAAVVEVEAEDELRVRRVWCAVDAGLVINPDGAANQVEGGVVQALSWTLKEQIRVEEGVITARDWDSYPILRFSEVPEIIVRFVGSAEDPPLGLGEVALGPVTAAAANAAAHALGARLRDLPLTRERVLASLL